MENFIFSKETIFVVIIMFAILFIYIIKTIPYKPQAKYISDKGLISICEHLKKETGMTPKYLYLMLLKKDLRERLQGPHRKNIKLDEREDHDKRKLVEFFNEKL